jgi:hypothetical protein
VALELLSGGPGSWFAGQDLCVGVHIEEKLGRPYGDAVVKGPPKGVVWFSASLLLTLQIACWIDSRSLSVSDADGLDIDSDSSTRGDATTDGGASACFSRPPKSSTITDFTPISTWTGTNGGGFILSSATGFQVSTGHNADLGAGETLPTVTPTPGTLSISATSKGSWVIPQIFTFDTQCLDASSFNGVGFTVDGSLGTCNIQFQVMSAPTEIAGTGDPRASCLAQMCYSRGALVTGLGPQIILFSSQQEVNGAPDAHLDPRQVTGVQWVINAPGGTTCAADFTIQDLVFVH